MSYRTEQEQIEIFTRWWKEKGRLTLVVLVLALAAYVGWTQWQSHQHQRVEAASVLYNELLQLVENKSADKLPLATRLRDEYGDTFYGQAALLFLAEEAAAKNDLAAAENHLDALIQQNIGDDLAFTARLRSAKVLHALGREDEALARLDGEAPAGFKILFAELRGDIYMAQGQNDKARQAYQEAISAEEPDSAGQKEMLEMKLSQAGGTP